MVFLFSDAQSREQREITDILRRHGADVISPSQVTLRHASFLLVCISSPVTLQAEKGVVVFSSDCGSFANQRLPGTLCGVCEADNKTALRILQKNRNPVITCGMDPRSALTLSGVCDGAVSVGLQRALTDKNGAGLSPAEYPIRLTRPYSPFAVLAATAVLLREGILPTRF